jgi:hypothetical protein
MKKHEEEGADSSLRPVSVSRRMQGFAQNDNSRWAETPIQPQLAPK